MRIHRAIRRSAVAAAAASVAAVIPFAAISSAVSPRVAPATPQNVAAISGAKTLSVSWTESSNGAIVYVAKAQAAGRATKTCRTKLLTCTIAALTNGVVYNVTVTGANKSGASAPSGDITATVGVPGPPLMIHASPNTAAATISWAPPKASGVAKVTSYVATASPGGYSCTASATLVSSAARSCEISGLSSGTSYSVTVSATNSFGTGAPSKQASVTAN
jgi:hypothetical protein